MQCPSCDGLLEELTVGSVCIRLCTGVCGGIWFDAKELEKVDEGFEADGAALANLPVPARAGLTTKLRRSCPRCDDVVMMRRFTSLLREVDVDECPGCGGFWLDAGELALLRAENQAPGSREKLKSAASQGGLAAKWEECSQADADAWRAVGQICRVLRINIGGAG